MAVAFAIDEGIARLKGFVEPSQPSIPHLAVVPVACEQVASIPAVATVENPLETLNRYFEEGRQLSRR